MNKKNLKLLFSILVLSGCGLSTIKTPSSSIISSGISSSSKLDEIIEEEKEEGMPLRLWYDEEAPKINENSPECNMDWGADVGWQDWSLPIGNGYFGANIFGRTETERIQITEKTLSNPWIINGQQKGGLNNFSETYIDFNHNQTGISEYVRYLNLKNAISGVSYEYNGVTYKREYFASYKDNCLVIYLEASEEEELNFTLRPTIPFEQDYMVSPNDGASKSGEVVSFVEYNEGIIELYGKLGYYDVDFFGRYHVYTEDGEVSASTAVNKYKDTSGLTHSDIDGTIVVENATKAYIIVTLGTDYELSSDMFTANDYAKPTAFTNIDYARMKVEENFAEIEELTWDMSFEEAYKTLRKRHVDDYKELFGRVELNLNCLEEDFNITTDELLKKYRLNKYSSYLEVLLFQYGRYMLIESSRSGALPANLQGAWNAYNTPPWSSGYWNNINVQMNYWPAFSTNIAETFESYIELNDAYMKQAELNATNLVSWHNPSVLNKDGGNGWTIGVASNPFFINGDRSSGNMCFTTQLYWDYYQFTKDEEILEKVYDVLANAARYVTKCVKEDEQGFCLVEYCDSPEQWVNGEWYYTKGTTYAQTFAYLNNYYALQAAIEMGIDINDPKVLSNQKYSVLKTVLEQIDKYDPINIGLSGQIKEFREEDYYGSVGDPNHRHISQLVGLYPGNLINETTPAWLDAAKVTLEGRKNFNEPYGWVYAHKMNLYARAKDGNKAHEMLNLLINRTIANNLWSMYKNCFQVEADFGTTAGISEMLLQSHEGYIAPLKALSSKWTEGSYSGLVARGNFEISAAWKDSLASEIKIKSNAGEEAKVSYPSITNAKVVNSKGEIIDYEIEGADLISFNTIKGETYTITGFEKIEKISNPKMMKYEQINNTLEFTFTEVEGVNKYNIYKAIDNDSTYELIGSTYSNNYSYSVSDYELGRRVTYCVTAVDKNGIESDRTLCYKNLLSKEVHLNNISYNIKEDKSLEINVDAIGSISSYNLYEKSDTDGTYLLVKESKYPLFVYDDYKTYANYAITIVSAHDGVESQKYWLNTNNNSSNILAGKVFIPTEEALNSVFPPWDENLYFGYETLTDGIKEELNGRFSTSYDGFVDATVDLGKIYTLNDLKLYDYSNELKYLGNDITIQVYYSGEWETVIHVENNNDLNRYRINNLNGMSWVEFDLGSVQAEKIRVFISSTVPSYSISLYEIECSGF